MIDEVFQVLKDGLTVELRMVAGPSADPGQDPVVFLSADQGNTIEFRRGAVTMMLVTLEEDRRLLPPDPYRRTLPDGSTQAVQPSIPLNIYVLFVARYTDYLDSLRSLSFIVQYFQKNRLVDRRSAPGLSSRIDKLVCELVTFPAGQENPIWSTLQTPYQPSLLYRVRVIVFQDEDAVPAAAPTAIDVRVKS